MSAENKSPKLRIALKLFVLVARALWLATMIITPLLGMWLSSSLAAYHNRSLWACLAVGLLLFPILPLVWDRVYLWRDRKKAPDRNRILTTADRWVLRTLALNGAFIAIVLTIAPASAFRALSTRGDWMLDGSDSAFANNVRGKLFALADTLRGAYGDDDAKELYGESDIAPDFGDEPPAVANDHWPLPDEIHALAASIPASAEGDYRQVARYLRGRISDPFELTKAMHDYVVIRLEYDHTGLAAAQQGRAAWPSQTPEDVFRARRAVCEGYARLLAAMGDEAGIEIAYVVGQSRRRAMETDGVGHAWNAARLDGAWYLIDATWNDDGLDSSGRHRTETTYLFTPPELFGLDHFPEDAKWQLRGEPIDLGEFMRQPGIRPRFALLSLELRQPQRSQVTVSGRFDAVIENPRGAYLMAYARRGESDEIECQVQRAETTRVTCNLDRPGRYSVHLYGNDKPSGSFPHIAELFVNNR